MLSPLLLLVLLLLTVLRWCLVPVRLHLYRMQRETVHVVIQSSTVHYPQDANAQVRYGPELRWFALPSCRSVHFAARFRLH